VEKAGAAGERRGNAAVVNKEEWRQIDWARSLLGLGERASLQEIRRAYRTMSKRYHPDLAAEEAEEGEKGPPMRDINRAYQLLKEYCSNYRYPLVKDLTAEVDDEEWWMNRFGQDPLWGKSPGGS